MKYGMMTPVLGDGFIPSDYIFNNCSGIQITSIGTDYDGRVSIEGLIVPKSLKDRTFNAPSRIYKKIIINPPATIVIWNDGTKTVVKATENDIYDPEKGVALCFLKKYFNTLYRQVLKDANDIYNEKLEEDVKCNDFVSGINSGFKDAVLQASVTSVIKSINDAARKAFLGDEKKEDEGDK